MTATKRALKAACIITALVICVTVFCIAAFAQSGSVHIIDSANVISDADEKRIQEKADAVAGKTGFNIVVISADDIGTPKTDDHVVEFADDKYEELCGIDTNGILFLINCDTKYDYISTSGECIEYFSDARIDEIFDVIWDDLVDENFAQAAYSFLNRVEYYYDKGRVNYDFHRAAGRFHIDIIGVLRFIIISAFLSCMFGMGIYTANKKQFNIEKPATRNYILDNSLVFDKKSDVYVGRTVHTSYTPRTTSSSGGSHRSSHHSSVHRSRSGGHYGGCGRHR